MSLTMNRQSGMNWAKQSDGPNCNPIKNQRNPKKAENFRGAQKQKLDLKKNVILSDSFRETNRDKDRYRDRDRVFFYVWEQNYKYILIIVELWDIACFYSFIAKT